MLDFQKYRYIKTRRNDLVVIIDNLRNKYSDIAIMFRLYVINLFFPLGMLASWTADIVFTNTINKDNDKNRS
jgi:hypothetical protein